MKNLRINKRLAASFVSFTMLTTSLVGCTTKEDASFDYETLEDGTIECSGKIDYDLLKEYEVVELTIFDKKELYIVEHKNYTAVNLNVISYYINIFDNKQIYNSLENYQNKSLEVLGKSDDYLIYYDIVKENYTVKEVNDLLDKIREDRSLEKNNTLVKNK